MVRFSIALVSGRCTTVSFPALACASEHIWQRALEVMDLMLQQNVEPNIVSYGTAISACARGGAYILKKAILFLVPWSFETHYTTHIVRSYGGFVVVLSSAVRRRIITFTGLRQALRRLVVSVRSRSDIHTHNALLMVLVFCILLAGVRRHLSRRCCVLRPPEMPLTRRACIRHT